MDTIFSETNRKTISQIKTELSDSNIDFSDIVREKGKKEKYVKRYVDSLDIIRETQRPRESTVKVEEKEETKVEEKELTKTESKQLEKEGEKVIERAETLIDTMTQSLINEAETSLEKDEIILSLVILGHGCEDLTTPWPAKSEFSRYYRNNVRVYSRACVPDTVTLGNLASNPEIIRDIHHRFSSVPRNETSAIIRDYAEDSRFEYQNDILYSLKIKLNGRLHKVLKKNNLTKNYKFCDILGCNLQEFKLYFESKFTEGMSWELMGKEIHIDHIIPCDSAKEEEQLIKLFHYTNLQPLWAKDNITKSNKII